MTPTERMYTELERQGKRSSALCKYLDVGTSYMAGWKSSNTIPPARYLVGISEFLGVSVDWLLTGKERGSENPSPSIWDLSEYQKTVAHTYFPELTDEQVALINNFEKLDEKNKKEIRLLIQIKLGEELEGVSSGSLTSKGSSSGSTETA